MRPTLWAGAVAVEDDRLLLVRRPSPPGAGTWSVPATEVAAGELLIAAVVRAVEEAAGLEAVCGSLLGPVELLDDGHRVLLAFEATVLSDDEPSPGAAWVELDDVTTHPLLDGIPELLADRGILPLIA